MIIVLVSTQTIIYSYRAMRKAHPRCDANRPVFVKYGFGLLTSSVLLDFFTNCIQCIASYYVVITYHLSVSQ